MKKKLADGALVITIIILILALLRTCEDKAAFQKINDQNKDSAHHYRNKLGQQVTKITILEGSVKDLKKINSTKDSTLRKLQSLVDKKTTAATVLSNVTTNSGKSKTVLTFTSVVHDTITGQCDTVYPTYSTSWKDKWSEGTIVATKDSIKRDFKTFNEFSITEKYERPKYWKEKQPTITVTNLNPNTNTTEIKTFRIGKPKSRRAFVFGLGFIGGTAATIGLIKSFSK